MRRRALSEEAVEVALLVVELGLEEPVDEAGEEDSDRFVRAKLDKPLLPWVEEALGIMRLGCRLGDLESSWSRRTLASQRWEMREARSAGERVPKIEDLDLLSFGQVAVLQVWEIVRTFVETRPPTLSSKRECGE
jgi:hypothetical protein